MVILTLGVFVFLLIFLVSIQNNEGLFILLLLLAYKVTGFSMVFSHIYGILFYFIHVMNKKTYLLNMTGLWHS